MIKSINLSSESTSFKSEQSKKKNKAEDETRILPNTLKTRWGQEFQKTSSAFIDYPAKGLKGDINSDFYEFLTMGTVPYVIGSLMFMFVFNCLNKIEPKAAKVGNKMALGVLFYGLFKNLSKNLVTTPVKMATGVDTEMPYQNKVYPLPKEAGEAATIEPQYQQRKVFDSKEFYRKDLLDRAYFDKVAKKLGLGEDLNDSVSETSPIIQNIVATSSTAKSLISYSWAGVGVALAVQDSWTDFFDSIKNRKLYVSKPNDDFATKLGGKIKNWGENTCNIVKTFGKSFGRACKSLWSGNPADTGFMKHSGKLFVGASAALTAILTANTILRAKNMARNKNINTIDRQKESTVI